MKFAEFWRKLDTRRKLIAAFRKAGLYLGADDRPIFPRIIHVSTGENHVRVLFDLPAGLDPKLVEKNRFVFKQIFGETIELDGDVKRFDLTIYTASVPSELAYNASEILPSVKGHRLGIIAGIDRNGRYTTFDLATHPHILIAGETGSGKSTQLRSILTTLILAKKPSELQLYLADCKKSEFHVFRNVEHVQCVLSRPADIRQMLAHIKRELDERSDLTETFEVGHIDDLPAEHRRPYIVVAIDEFVMLRKDEEIMSVLTEIVAIGRTLGVFAILSMQRPNSRVLDTTIRANLTVSMGFKLRDKTEARIVNTPGAERIESPGRFIMKADKTTELQAPYLSMDKARELLTPFTVTKKAKKIKVDEASVLTEEDVFVDWFRGGERI